jgi:hypothetical protein
MVKSYERKGRSLIYPKHDFRNADYLRSNTLRAIFKSVRYISATNDHVSICICRTSCRVDTKQEL